MLWVLTVTECLQCPASLPHAALTCRCHLLNHCFLCSLASEGSSPSNLGISYLQR